MKLEIFWSAVPLFVLLAMFAWGAQGLSSSYFTGRPRTRSRSTSIGKQWMWKIQHPEGQREINELHVPVGRPVQADAWPREDVIHSFYIPAFRIKQDVVPGPLHHDLVPGRPRPGDYHLFCAEYCGTEHSGMIGWVIVMEPRDYENWLAGGGGRQVDGRLQGDEALPATRLLRTCHRLDETGTRAPSLEGRVRHARCKLDDGRTVIGGRQLHPRVDPQSQGEDRRRATSRVMPTFQGQVSEEQL